MLQKKKIYFSYSNYFRLSVPDSDEEVGLYALGQFKGS